MIRLVKGRMGNLRIILTNGYVALQGVDRAMELTEEHVESPPVARRSLGPALAVPQPRHSKEHQERGWVGGWVVGTTRAIQRVV